MTVAPNEADELRYLRSSRAIRERASQLYDLGLAGGLEHFHVDESRLPALADAVVRVTRESYPDVRTVPYHARWRHFDAGGVNRLGRIEARLASLVPPERLRSEFELVITSVLLDAGAGASWSYAEAGGARYTRSEGLAVASFDLFASGALASDPRSAPLRADASVLRAFDTTRLEGALQVTRDNPLVGVEGRVAVLRRLGEIVGASPRYFEGGRLGSLGTHLVSLSRDAALPASVVLETVLEALSEIWPGRETCAGQNLGDVWTHPLVGRVPLHKLSQWLTYSLCEPLERYGVRVVDLDALTGLAEYRNGGLFVDGGVLVPKHADAFSAAHPVGSSLVVEWRALTVALLDRTAAAVRALLRLSPEELPLARVLEGGTWRAGRLLAQERRPDGSPPIRVASDGTVF